MSAVVDLNTLARRLSWMDEWAVLAGFAKIEAIVDQVAAVKYVTKYVVKGGDIDISESLERYIHQVSLVRYFRPLCVARRRRGFYGRCERAHLSSFVT